MEVNFTLWTKHVGFLPYPPFYKLHLSLKKSLVLHLSHTHSVADSYTIHLHNGIPMCLFWRAWFRPETSQATRLPRNSSPKQLKFEPDNNNNNNWNLYSAISIPKMFKSAAHYHNLSHSQQRLNGRTWKGVF